MFRLISRIIVENPRIIPAATESSYNRAMISRGIVVQRRHAMCREFLRHAGTGALRCDVTGRAKYSQLHCRNPSEMTTKSAKPWETT